MVSSSCSSTTTTTTRLLGRWLLLISSLLVISLISAQSSSHSHNNNLRSASQRWLQQTTTSDCTESCCQQYSANTSIECSTTTAATEEEDTAGPLSAIPFAVQIILIIILLSLSAAFSGLTLGLMSLDKTGLEIVMGGDDVINAQRAKSIYPVRKRGNLLLCTLLMGNVSVNALLSILLADKAGGLAGFLSSTFLIVIFGEIIPQAIGSRYSLAIGSASVPLVRVVIFLFYPVAFPLSWCLDKAMGKEIATTYSTSEMMKLLQIHVMENVLDAETAVAMTGALKYKNLSVRQIMTPVETVFMLSIDDKLNFETMAKIFKTGFSRIPIYEVNRNNVIGLLFVKDLIFADPEDETRVADLIDIFGRKLHVVWIDDKLGDVLRELKKGRSHMALVRDVNNDDKTQDPFYELKGIITLEDIIEEIIGDEIVDETDVDPGRTQDANGEREDSMRWAKLRMLDSKIVDEHLSVDEARAVTAHLSLNYPHIVSLLTEHQLFRLIAETPVSVLPAATHEVGQVLPNDLLYEKELPADFSTLILAGKVTVVAGADCFKTDVSSWAFLGQNAVLDGNFKSDFSAFVSTGPCRCIFLKRSRFSAAVDASVLERRSTGHHIGQEPSTNVSPVSPHFHRSGSNTDTPPELRESSKQQKLLVALQLVADAESLPSDPTPDQDGRRSLIGSMTSSNSALAPSNDGKD